MKRTLKWLATASMIPAVLVATGTTAFADTPARSFPDCPVLSEGHTSGPCVIRLQAGLDLVNPGYNLTPDGIFGSRTRIAVLDFQGRNHLGADGIFGQVTADELTRQTTRPGQTPTAPLPSRPSSPLPADMVTPTQARSIALGLIDATGPLALQCGLSKIGDRIRAQSVATDAIKESLALAGAKKGCNATKNMVEAIGVITAVAALDMPVSIKLVQSEKRVPGPLGLLGVQTCGVDIQAGASQQLSRHFTASYRCH